MKKRAPPSGTVFSYPYLWAYQEKRGLKHAKDRICCMAFSSVKPDGTEVLVILAISDQEAVTREGAIEISLMEKVNAGLDPSRPAFVHLTEFNLDQLGKSWFFNANAKILGRFGKAFSEHIVARIAVAMKNKLTQKIDRRL